MVKNIHKELVDLDLFAIFARDENGLELIWSGPEGWQWVEDMDYAGFPNSFSENEADVIVLELKEKFENS